MKFWHEVPYAACRMDVRLPNYIQKVAVARIVYSSENLKAKPISFLRKTMTVFQHMEAVQGFANNVFFFLKLKAIMRIQQQQLVKEEGKVSWKFNAAISIF